jgi:nucleoside-diphosphate-sugar epimerase
MPQELLTITGGAGRIGSALSPLLRDRYRIRLADRHEPPADVECDDRILADITDLSAAERAVAGASAVLHLAGNPSTAATWDEVRSTNIDGTFNVFEAARRQGVDKVVFASTNHVMGFYALEEKFPIDTRGPIRPDSLYGVSKAFGEALARYYSDTFGMSMQCLRIGWFTSQVPSSASLNALWISARDLAQIVRQCLDSPRKFGVYNATSNNPQRQWDLQASREDLGFAPVDDVTRVARPGAGNAYVDPKAGVLRAHTG